MEGCSLCVKATPDGYIGRHDIKGVVIDTRKASMHAAVHGHGKAHPSAAHELLFVWIGSRYTYLADCCMPRQGSTHSPVIQPWMG